MKLSKKATNTLKAMTAITTLLVLSDQLFAKDLLSDALTGDVKDSLGGSAAFWKVFILVDIILATAMAVKAKSPMVFLGVAGVAFIPAFLLKSFVFGG